MRFGPLAVTLDRPRNGNGSGTSHHAPPSDHARARKMPPLADSDNADSEIAPNDWLNPPHHENTDDEDADVALVKQRLRDSANHRRALGVEADWVLVLQFRDSKQWLRWDNAVNKCVSLMANGANPEKYVTHNLMGCLLDKVTAMATQVKPDTSIGPDSDAPIDQQAAAEAEALTRHLYLLNGGDTHTQRVADEAAALGIAWTLEHWEKDAPAAIPKYGKNGELIGRSIAFVGEEKSPHISPLEIYLDPMYRSYEDGRFLIIHKRVALSWVETMYPDMRGLIEPDATDANASISGYSGLADGTGATNYSSDTTRKGVFYTQMFEKPSPRFPKGRYIAIAGGRRLTKANAAWPTPPGPNGGFPVARCVYKESPLHPYGKGLGVDLVALQVTYNRLLSRVLWRVEEDKITWFVANDTAIGNDALDSVITENLRYRRIQYDATAGPPPVQHPNQNVLSDLWRFRDAVWTDMQNIAGVHDVNMASTPPGVDSGVGIDLLQQGDRTQLASFTSSLEQYAVYRDSLRIGIYGAYVSESLPRMMSLDPTAGTDPRGARSAAMSFRALTNGGGCTVRVEPGSATPKTMAGQKQEIIDRMKAGFYGPIGADPISSLQTSILTMKAMALVSSDQSLLPLIAAQEQNLQQAIKNQPNPQMIAQQQMLHEQQLEQQKNKHQAESMAISEEGAQAADARKAALVAHNTANTMAINAHNASLAQTTDQIGTDSQNQADMVQSQADNSHEILMAMLERMVPSLTGKMTPGGTKKLQQIIGIDGPEPPPTAAKPQPGASK